MLDIIGKIFIAILCFAIIGATWGLIQYVTNRIFGDKQD